MHAWPLTLLLLMAALTSACGDSTDPGQPGKLALEGTVSRADGEPLDIRRTLEVEALLIVNTPAEHRRGNCPEETQHRATLSLNLDEKHEFGILLAPDAFLPISHPSCPLRRFATLQPVAFRMSGTLGNIRTDTRIDASLIRTTGVQWVARVPLVFDRAALGPVGQGEADLVPDPAAVLTSIVFETRGFSEESCAVNEGCVIRSGVRRLLRFDTHIINRGASDLMIGDPEQAPDAEYDACHAHIHIGGSSRYELLDIDGELVLEGHKQGFCLMDTTIVSGGERGKFDCENQGITAGWADVYDRDIDCQWVDITDIQSGSYQLRITVNPDFAFGEVDYSNNAVLIPVNIPEDI